MKKVKKNKTNGKRKETNYCIGCSGNFGPAFFPDAQKGKVSFTVLRGGFFRFHFRFYLLAHFLLLLVVDA